MMSQNFIRKIRGTLVRDTCRRWPDMPSLTMARWLASNHPDKFKDVESARASIRIVRGKQGDRHRSEVPSDLFDAEQRPYNPFRLPDASRENYPIHHISDPGARVLVISDLQVPFQDNQAIGAALTYGIDCGCTHVFINGDFLDFYQLSRFIRDPRERDPASELKIGRIILRKIRRAFPRAKIYLKEGNHEDRWQNWMRVNAPQYIGINEFRLTVLLRLNRLGITMIPDKQRVLLGEHLWAMHGHEFVRGSEPVNPARTAFSKLKECCIIGHCHRISQHDEKTISDRIISGYSTGCLCGLHPRFMPINNWQLGFAVVHLDDRGSGFHVENKKVIKGRVY